MKTNPTLSICIATYNRASYLRTALEHLRLQVQDDPDINADIEIVISDNASPDNTKEVAESFLKYFKNFVYTRNENNIGFDLNSLNVVKNASGDWCWFHGDDDIILRGGIKNILNLIKSNHFGFIGVSSFAMKVEHDYTKESPINDITINSTSDITDAYFDNYCQGIFSSLVFPRKDWLAAANTHHFMRYWLYYEATLQLLSASNKPLAFVATPLIAMIQDCRWAEEGTELYTFGNSCILLDRMKSWGFDNERVSLELIENSRRLPLILLRAKGNGLDYDSRHLRYIWKELSFTSIPIRLLAIFIFFTPTSLIRLIRDTRHKILGSTPTHRLVDFKQP